MDFDTETYDEWVKSGLPYYISNPNPRKKGERNYNHYAKGEDKIVFHKTMIVKDAYDGEEHEHDVVIVEHGGKGKKSTYTVGTLDTPYQSKGYSTPDGALKLFTKGTFNTLKEAKQYISRGEKLGNCEHENGFKLVDPDSTFYDTHELYDFECVDCGITAMGDVEPNFRYFGESNEKYLDLSAETFNAEHPDTGELLACPHCEKEVDWLETKASITVHCPHCSTQIGSDDGHHMNDIGSKWGTDDSELYEIETKLEQERDKMSFGKGAETFNAQMDGEKLMVGSRDFNDGSMMVGIGTEDMDVDDPDFMEMMIGEDGEIEYFTMPTGVNHYQRMYKPKPAHYGKMKTQNETNKSAGGDFIRTDGDGKHAETFNAYQVDLPECCKDTEWIWRQAGLEEDKMVQLWKLQKPVIAKLRKSLKIPADVCLFPFWKDYTSEGWQLAFPYHAIYEESTDLEDMDGVSVGKVSKGLIGELRKVAIPDDLEPHSLDQLLSSRKAETFGAESLKGRWNEGVTRVVHGVAVTKTPMAERYANEKPDYRISYKGFNARISYSGVAFYLPCWEYKSYGLKVRGKHHRSGCFGNPMEALLSFKASVDSVDMNAETFNGEGDFKKGMQMGAGAIVGIMGVQVVVGGVVYGLLKLMGKE
tara:strand:+ start:268 stop:2199 length:1932 start_codon:yes stop_codon:yes gene_type:complete